MFVSTSPSSHAYGPVRFSGNEDKKTNKDEKETIYNFDLEAAKAKRAALEEAAARDRGARLNITNPEDLNRVQEWHKAYGGSHQLYSSSKGAGKAR